MRVGASHEIDETGATKLRNSALNNLLCLQDGRSGTLTAPNGPSQSVLVTKALRYNPGELHRFTQLGVSQCMCFMT